MTLIVIRIKEKNMHYSKKTFKEILNEYNLLNVPYYQREYVWEGKNNKDARTTYNKFILDISNEYFESPSARYFIGNIAVNRTDTTEIVDGQQRITTLILFLCILADNFCSDKKKEFNKTVVYNEEGLFVLQEENYLTKEIEGSLNYKPFTGTEERIELDKAISRTINLIQRHYGKKSTPEFDGLYDYILNNVEAIIIEYNNGKDALRYFLNINSFSIKLTPEEIFLTILSQALKIARIPTTIYEVKSKLKNIESRYEKIKILDIIKIFLLAYYKNDKDINDLNSGSLDIGKWMSYYHTDVYSQPFDAKDFCNEFLQYLIDLNHLLNMYQGKITPIDKWSPIYLTYSLLKYQKYDDLVELLEIIFKNRHDYHGVNLYKNGTKQFDIDSLTDLSKRINLTLINNYIRDWNKRLDLLTSNIKLQTNGSPDLLIEDIIENTKANINKIFSLTYNNDIQSVIKPSINDKSRIILVIFAIQQGFLSFTANNSESYFSYIDDVLNSGRFTIEHLYSVKELTDNTRLENWKTIRGKFDNSNDFDVERGMFENLSLLNRTSNSSANDSEIYNKLPKYKNAHSVLGSGDEYLIQSFVGDSNYFLNDNIFKLGLPERKITNIRQNTWEHSDNNRKFSVELLAKALDALK